METYRFDVVVVGAGIAGASAAAALAADRRVAVLEAEAIAGYHTTGRSAAMWIQNYGPPDARVLTRLSRAFLVNPPDGFAEQPLVSPRAILFVARTGQERELAQMLAEGEGLREASVAEARAMVPALRADYIVAAALEEHAFDIDVAALHQGFLRQACARGAVLALSSRVVGFRRSGGQWLIETETPQARFQAPIVVNAAGAWGDVVAEMAGAAKLGLQPCRRTGVIINPAPWHVADWPVVHDVAHNWYVRPEARTRLMVTPADETPVPPHDVQPEEYDIALGIHRMQEALAINVQRVERAWAGLRTFTPDRSFAIGWDGAVEGFFWCVGQGGCGIQTSPAAGRLVADLITERDPGAAAEALPRLDPRRFGSANRQTV
ncbi:MAG: FAD-binding oxidoreductase [Acetobacteraceae bacterium]|nr:FAD-binding oxidoreductase [Acetobacteraceae bacterium]